MCGCAQYNVCQMPFTHWPTHELSTKEIQITIKIWNGEEFKLKLQNEADWNLELACVRAAHEKCLHYFIKLYSCMFGCDSIWLWFAIWLLFGAFSQIQNAHSPIKLIPGKTYQPPFTWCIVCFKYECGKMVTAAAVFYW